MNIRSLTRGDGVVIGAAVLLFIASFLDTFACDGGTCGKVPNAWDNGALLLGLYLAGLIGAVLIVFSRSLSQPRKFAGLDIGQFGIALTVFAAWTSLGAIFDPAGPLDNVKGLSAGSGLILGLIAALLLAAAAVATPMVGLLKAGLISAPKPPAPTGPYGGLPFGAQSGGPAMGYGYPGNPGAPGTPQNFGAQPGQPQYGAPQPGPGQQPAAGQYQPFGAPQGHQPGQQQPAAAQTAPPAQQQGGAPAAEFAAFWFAVPVTRPLYGEDGSGAPVAELAPGTWYLAVDQRGTGLVAQTQDGRRGVLQDVSGIQRG